MEHNYIKIDEDATVKHTVINQRDHNIDKLDNLADLPQVPAVFAVCGRVNGEPANPRYIGETGNLQQEIMQLFDPKVPPPDSNNCFKEFMLSIKTKELVYTMLPDSSEQERKNIQTNWTKKYQPECNEVLNKIH